MQTKRTPVEVLVRNPKTGEIHRELLPTTKDIVGQLREYGFTGWEYKVDRIHTR